MRFDGKIVVVTGATSGIGEASARLFVEEGAYVYLIGRSVEKGRHVEEEINRSAGQRAKFISCDVSEEKQIESLRRQIEEREDHVDVLFNNAGAFITQRLPEITTDAWANSFQVNVNGVMLMTRAFMPLLQKAGGNIVNNASISGLQSFTSGEANYLYGSSKAAQIKFSKICALNYARDVRVNVICPGIVDTDIYTNKDYSRFDGFIPMGRIASPEEIAKVVLFLASDDAAYITGAVLPVDGGASLR